MARRPRAPEKEQESPLLAALRFVSIAQQDEGVPYQTHCRLEGNYAVAFDGVLAAGHPLPYELYACPHTLKMVAALSKVRGAHNMTMLDSHQLSITTDRYRVLVPCLPPIEVEQIQADAALYDIGPEWIEAAVKAGVFVTEAGQTVLASSVITQPYSLVGTNGVCLIEAAGKYNTPSGLMIPYPFINAANKIDAKPVKFGFSETSFTLHFDNGAWLRTQLYLDALPKLENVLACMLDHHATEIPDGLDFAIDAVIKFSSDARTMHIRNGKVCSHDTDDAGAQYALDGLPGEASMNGAHLKKMLPLFTKADFFTQHDKVVLLGDGIRGLLMKYGRK